MKKIRPTLFILFALVLCSCSEKNDHDIIEVSKAATAPVIDGIADDLCWKNISWRPLDQTWLGESYTPEDFTGNYKLAWTEDGLFLLVKVIDDQLFDQHKDPLTLWWDDDCVEIFVDEDNSGGNHQFTHNAFAYHVALDGNVVDMDIEEKGRLYNDHVAMKKVTEDDITLWELKIKVFDDSYVDGEENIPVMLSEGKKIGFMLAYCDNDASAERENFIGSVFVPGEDKNRGWIDASIFSTLILKD
ncbi:sugar-binding protein [Sungkyunkwania multivorans]|uniref:Sugar-binding protein n=1 Tax=Sungkyunkwania multivorans TaxID=1173618 RepID=A0ABW3CVW6_9FLAO